jgi:hypothetical protein
MFTFNKDNLKVGMVVGFVYTSSTVEKNRRREDSFMIIRSIEKMIATVDVWNMQHRLYNEIHIYYDFSTSLYLDNQSPNLVKYNTIIPGSKFDDQLNKLKIEK